jgi:hypothetical protein
MYLDSALHAGMTESKGLLEVTEVHLAFAKE